MLFPTVDFAVFFVVVLTASWMLRPNRRAWRVFLLIASAVFYLDPFNPVLSDGQRFISVNPVIVGTTVAVMLVSAQILRVAFPRRLHAPGPEPVEVDGAPAGDDPAAPVADGADPVPAGEPPAGPGRIGALAVESRTSGPAPTAPDPVPSPQVLWGAPAVVTVLVAAANLAVTFLFPERADQNARWLLLLMGMACVNQAFAKAVHAARPEGRRTPISRQLVIAAVAVDLVVLGWFKYANWFAEMWTDLAARAGVELDWFPGVVLPIAISFFTFQAISYVVDVGRGEQRPVPLVDFTVYLTFFAHVVAGPIVRVHEFVPQLRRRADPRYVPAAEAFELIFRGLFKKIVISSYLATQIVQPVLETPAGFSRVEVLVAIAGYAVQIYADFSGYTDIAIGVALLIGLRLPENFDAPYRALSLQDFWRRWHMTLSRWLRDYVYIPLGGSRRGPTHTQVNIMITMLLGGLWHGANGTFVVWGALHGAGLVAERRVRDWWAGRAGGPLGLPSAVVGVLQWAWTMSVICVGWVFFHARDVDSALAVLGQLVTGASLPGAASPVTPLLVCVIAASFASQFVPPELPRRLFDRLAGAPPLLQAAAGASALLLLVVLGPEGVPPFIYFQF